jgi:hypothetical protein
MCKRHINIYMNITFEMAILKISCNLGANWGGAGTLLQMSV